MIRACIAHAERTGRSVPLELQGEESWRLQYLRIGDDFTRSWAAFGDVLQQLRINAKMSQTELAEAVMRDTAQIIRWEQGVALPGLLTVERLADALHVTGPRRESFETLADARPITWSQDQGQGGVHGSDESNLLLRLYIPSQRLYAPEADRVLSLFRDWIMVAHGHGIRQSGYRTAAGQMYEFFVDGSIKRADFRRDFDEFSNFLTVCSTDTSLAAEKLAQMGFGRAASTDFVTRFGREVRRLQVDLAHERERRVLAIRHDLEEELVDSGIELGLVPSAQINALIERLVPGSSAVDSFALLAASQSGRSVQPIPALALNFNQQYINAFESTIIQNVQGVIHLSADAKKFLSLIDRFGGEETPSLKAAVHELEDPDARPSDRTAAKRRLRRFLGQVAGAAHDVGLDLLEKYLESKMGL